MRKEVSADSVVKDMGAAALTLLIRLVCALDRIDGHGGQRLAHLLAIEASRPLHRRLDLCSDV